MATVGRWSGGVAGDGGDGGGDIGAEAVLRRKGQCVKKERSMISDHSLANILY